MMTVKLLVRCVIISLILFSCQSKTSNSIDKNIGEQFKLTHIVDTSGKEVELDLSTSELTIIDFWNNLCPPCITDMKQFPDLIKGKESKISIISISLSQFWVWKPTLIEHKGVFSFLNNDIPNWKHYNLMTKDNLRFKNELSSDRLRELDSAYGIKGNPAYFVLDKTGKILDRPVSAVQYLKDLD
jgi:thiol-disulfide isomerase/thioredoxin